MSETTVIYNGSCPVCSREISAYRQYSEARALPLAFTDLTDADLSRYGLTPDDAARELHVIQDGQLLRGMEASAALWLAMPRFRWLGRFVQWPGVRWVADVVYTRALAPALYGWHRRRAARQAKT